MQQAKEWIVQNNQSRWFQDTIKPYLYYKTVDSLGSANFRVIKVDDVTEQMLNATNSEVVEEKVDLSKYAPIENFKELQNKVDMLNERLNTYEKFINNLTQPKQIENVETKQDEKINPLLKYQEYIYYKEEYNETHKQANLSIIHQALSTFLEGMIGAFENIEEVSRDNMEERALIKGKIKQIYQAFS